MDTEALDIQEFYNDVAREFADDWYTNDSLLPVLKRFVELLPPAPKVLDLGCGAGYESMRLKGLGADVVGVDYSAEPLRIARERNPGIMFEQADFRHLSPMLGRFDGIAAIASLIHIRDDELDRVFAGMKNVLNENGVVMIVVIEGRGLSAERSVIERGGKKYRRNFYLHEKERLTAAAHNSGLSFDGEFEMAEELQKFGWKCFVFRTRQRV